MSYPFTEAKDGWSEAFSLCREKDQPITIKMLHRDGVFAHYKIFPSGRSQPMYGVARREAKIDSAAELLKKFACRSDCLQFMRCKRGLGSKALIAGDCDVNDFITSTEG